MQLIQTKKKPISKVGKKTRLGITQDTAWHSYSSRRCFRNGCDISDIRILFCGGNTSYRMGRYCSKTLAVIIWKEQNKLKIK